MLYGKFCRIAQEGKLRKLAVVVTKQWLLKGECHLLPGQSTGALNEGNRTGKDGLGRKRNLEQKLRAASEQRRELPGSGVILSGE